jgi:hypothetical protein
MLYYRYHNLPGDKPGPPARGLLVHGQDYYAAFLSIGVYGVQDLKFVTVPNAQTALVRSRGDPGAAIRGPPVGDDAHEPKVRLGRLQSPQQRVGSGIPHAQRVRSP